MLFCFFCREAPRFYTATRLVTALRALLPPSLPLPSAFEKSLAYTTRFCGAAPVSSAGGIDTLFSSLHAAELVTSVTDDGMEVKERLHEYECVALSNLFPSTVTAAKGLIPSLQRFADEALEEAIKLLRAAGAAADGVAEPEAV